MIHKFVFDENMTRKEGSLPDNMINAKELYSQNGVTQTSVSDHTLLNLAKKLGYIIITKDEKLVVMANKQQVDIIFAHGVKGGRWIFISKELKLRDRGYLRRLLVKEIQIKKDDLMIVPYFARGSQL